MVSSSSVSIPKFTPVKKGNWNRLTLLIFQQIKFFVWSFVFFVFYLLWCWTKPPCQSNPLAGQDLQPAKKEKIQVRTKLRQQLSSCLLDLVVVDIFFNLLKKYMMRFFPIQKSIWDSSLPIATYLHFRWIGVGVVVGEAGQELPVIPFLPLGRKRDLYNLCFSPQQIHRQRCKSRWAWRRKLRWSTPAPSKLQL